MKLKATKVGDHTLRVPTPQNSGLIEFQSAYDRSVELGRDNTFEFPIGFKLEIPEGYRLSVGTTAELHKQRITAEVVEDQVNGTKVELTYRGKFGSVVIGQGMKIARAWLTKVENIELELQPTKGEKSE